jgi:hypothetical protein
VISARRVVAPAKWDVMSSNRAMISARRAIAPARWETNPAHGRLAPERRLVNVTRDLI